MLINEDSLFIKCSGNIIKNSFWEANTTLEDFIGAIWFD